jgi:hypothetical protein
MADTLRRRMMNWKEADFRTLFGAPVSRSDGPWRSLYAGDGFAGLSVQPHTIAFSGLRAGNPGQNHTDLYAIGSLARVEIFFGLNGTPDYAVFFLKVDSDFIPPSGQQRYRSKTCLGAPSL